MLAKWIAETFDTLPPNASHRVGIGAFVMNDMGEVLVVQENSGTFTGTGVWKFPTGVVDEVALLAACVSSGLKVLCAIGAGARTDHTKIRVADLRESTNNPLSRAVTAINFATNIYLLHLHFWFRVAVMLSLATRSRISRLCSALQRVGGQWGLFLVPSLILIIA